MTLSIPRLLATLAGGLLVLVGLGSTLLSWSGLSILLGVVLLTWARGGRVRVSTTAAASPAAEPVSTPPQLVASCPCVTITQTYAVKVDPYCPWHGAG